MKRDPETVEHESKEAIAEETGLKRETVDTVTDGSWAWKYDSVTRRQVMKAGVGAGASALALGHGSGEAEGIAVSGTVLLGSVLAAGGAGLIIGGLWSGSDAQGDHETQDTANDADQWAEQVYVGATTVQDQRYRDLVEAHSELSSTRQSGYSRAKYDVLRTLADDESKSAAINAASEGVNEHFSTPIEGALYNQESAVRFGLNSLLILMDLQGLDDEYDALNDALENHTPLNRDDVNLDGHYPDNALFADGTQERSTGDGYHEMWVPDADSNMGDTALGWDAVTLPDDREIENLPRPVHQADDGVGSNQGTQDMAYNAADGSGSFSSYGGNFSEGDDLDDSGGMWLHYSGETSEKVCINPASMVKYIIGELDTARQQVTEDLNTVIDNVYDNYESSEVEEWWSDEYVNPTDALVSDITTVDDDDDINDDLIQRVSHATGLQVTKPRSSMTLETWEWDPDQGAKTNITTHDHVTGVTWYERESMSLDSLEVGTPYIVDESESPTNAEPVGTHTIVKRDDESGQGEGINRRDDNDGFTITSLEDADADTLEVENNEFASSDTDDLRQQSEDWYRSREELTDDGSAGFGGFGSSTNLAILGGGAAAAYALWRYWSEPKGEF